MTLAVPLVASLAFERLAANRVQIRMDVANRRSRQAAERSGCTPISGTWWTGTSATTTPAPGRRITTPPEAWRAAPSGARLLPG